VPLPILLALDALEIWHVVLLAVLGTLADSAGSTARQSLVPAAADLGGYSREPANALFTSAEHVGYRLGAPVAGLLLALGVGAADARSRRRCPRPAAVMIRQERSPARLLPRVVGLAPRAWRSSVRSASSSPASSSTGSACTRRCWPMTGGAAPIGVTVLVSTATRLFDTDGSNV
jgi:hypothetical protein